MNADPRRKLALWRRINSPVAIRVRDTKRADAAVRAWWENIFCYYDIDPASPDRWERVSWYLAVKAFPEFRLIQSAPVGRQKATPKRAKLLSKFEDYQAPKRGPKRGSKSKHFLTEHRAACAAAGVKTENGLKAAIAKAKRERKIEREGVELRRAIDAIQAQHQRNLAEPAVKSATKSTPKSNAKLNKQFRIR